MENLRIFNTQEEYEAWKDSDDYVVPNACKVNGEMIYNDFPEPFWVEALEDLKLWCGTTHNDGYTNSYVPGGSSVYYSFDKVNWNKMHRNPCVTVKKGEKVYLKNDKPYGGDTDNNIECITTGKYNIGGHILSLVYGDNYLDEWDSYPKDYAFYGFLTPASNMKLDGVVANESLIVNAKDLILPSFVCYKAYEDMFSSSKYLETAPKLPATTLSGYCYSDMFSHCINLKKVSVYGTGSEEAVFIRMFRNCSNLSYIKWLSLTEPKSGNYGYTTNWVEGVSPTGTFVKNANATWKTTRGVNFIPEGWDVYLYDPDKKHYVTRFVVKGITYEMYTHDLKDVTWEEFINNDSHNGMFEIVSDEVLYSGKPLYINDTKQTKSDNIVIEGVYTLTAPVAAE